MKKTIIKIGIVLSLATVATIGVHFATNQNNSAFELVFANIEAMASDSEGPITDPNIVLKSKSETKWNDSGTIESICCVPSHPDDQCHRKLEFNCN